MIDWTSSKLKMFALQKPLLKEWRDKPQSSRRHLQSTCLKNYLYLEYIKNLQHSTVKK